jgi:hypothetical protein
MKAELERRASEADDVTVLEYVLEWVGSGKTLLELATSLSESLKLGEGYVTRHMVSKYVNAIPGATEALAETRRDEASHALADSAIEIIDRDTNDKVEVAANKNAAEMRLKMAGFYNKAEYQQQNGVNVNVQVNNGQQHLDALRHRKVVRATVVTPALPAGPDVEVVSDA